MAFDADKQSGGGSGRSYVGNLLNNEWFMPGLLFIAFGLLGLYVSKDYDLGNVNQMGSGYFPRMLCTGLVVLGAVISWIGLFAKPPGESSGSAARGFTFVILSMAVFAGSIEGFQLPFIDVKVPSLGFVGALTLTLLVTSLADRNQKTWEVLFTTAIIVVLSVLTFIVALKLPFRLWPEL